MSNLTQYIQSGQSMQLLTQNGLNEVERKKLTQRIMTLVASNKGLGNVEPISIFMVALKMEIMGLSPELDTGYIVPFNGYAQFIIGYKGLQQLAMNTGLYIKVDCVAVKESDFVDYDLDSDTYTWNQEKLTFAQVVARKKEKTMGWRAFAIHLNGIKEEMFWSNEEIIVHHKKFSQTYNKKQGAYGDKTIDRMDRKAVLKYFINSNLIKTMDTSGSEKIRQALKLDQAVFTKNKFEYSDRELRDEFEVEVDNIEIGIQERHRQDAMLRQEKRGQGKPTSKMIERLHEYTDIAISHNFMQPDEDIENITFGRAGEIISAVKGLVDENGLKIPPLETMEEITFIGEDLTQDEWEETGYTDKDSINLLKSHDDFPTDKQIYVIDKNGLNPLSKILTKAEATKIIGDFYANK